MKIYTKTGDMGTTSLLGGKRVSKSDQRIEAYGTLDELNSYIGLLRDQKVNHDRKEILYSIQNELFTLGSLLAADPDKPKLKLPELVEESILKIEKEIDYMDKFLPPMKHFILPGGNQAVSFCHIARTICRRSERMCIALALNEPIPDLIIKYINRLSDYLFVLARLMGKRIKC